MLNEERKEKGCMGERKAREDKLREQKKNYMKLRGMEREGEGSMLEEEG